MKVMERTGFSFFTMWETDPLVVKADQTEEEEDAQLDALIQMEREMGNYLDDDTHIYDTFELPMLGAIPESGYPLGSKEFIEENKWRKYLENPGWVNYLSLPPYRLASFCYVSKGNIPFFPEVRYEGIPFAYEFPDPIPPVGFKPDYEDMTKSEIGQFSDMLEILQSDSLYRLPEPINPIGLGLHDSDDVTMGQDEPFFVGKRRDGRGSFFYYKKGLYIGDNSEDIQSHVDGSAVPENPDPRQRERIPDDIQIFVWNRDGGACVKCGSRENLAFDHIIPHSLGGSNSRRNLQLLCDSCNSKKSNKIGG